MRQMFRLNVDWFMQVLLDRKDRMSMYSGLEVRVPFCDHRLAAYLYNVPWRYKNYKEREKGLLREALAGVLPEEVRWRKKSPYPKTHHPDYFKRARGLLSDLLRNPNAPVFEVVERRALQALLRTENNPTPWFGQLMTTPQTVAYFLQMNAWMERHKVKVV
jgi:asparagine synthase (glutamine-hydrolysing)